MPHNIFPLWSKVQSGAWYMRTSIPQTVVSLCVVDRGLDR